MKFRRMGAQSDTAGAENLPMVRQGSALVRDEPEVLGHTDFLDLEGADLSANRAEVGDETEALLAFARSPDQQDPHDDFRTAWRGRTMLRVAGLLE